MKNVEFYICDVCKNQIGMIKKSGPNVFCCGQEMTKLEANTIEASTEKHIPAYTIEGNKVHVKVGSVDHPMTDEHYIEWIALVGENTTTRISLKPSDKPEAIFEYLPNSEIYAYCNLHGLWKAEVK